MVLGNLIRRGPSDFAYWAITIYGSPFQDDSTIQGFCNSPILTVVGYDQAPLHHPDKTHGLDIRVGLGCSRFARRYSGNRILFLFLRVLRCFSSPGYPSITMDS